MMRTLNFAKRNFKELIREPENIIFCMILPLFLLIIFQQFKIPSIEYSIEYFTPSIIIFSYSFLSLFTAQLIAKDRSSLLLTRLFISPMKPIEYIFGYLIALIPIAIIQSILFFIAAMAFNLSLNINVIYSILILIPISVLFIMMGILIGCISTDTQAPTIGSLIIQVVAFTSGMWFSIDMVGKAYKIICIVLPFSHTITLIRDVLLGKNTNIVTSILIILAYILLISVISSLIFYKKKFSDNK